MSKPEQPAPSPPAPAKPKSAPDSKATKPKPEFGGPAGPEPTRYGEWEKNGRCTDF
jgi:hypothetical protein